MKITKNYLRQVIIEAIEYYTSSQPTEQLVGQTITVNTGNGTKTLKIKNESGIDSRGNGFISLSNGIKVKFSVSKTSTGRENKVYIDPSYGSLGKALMPLLQKKYENKGQ